jgi:sterol 14-demethylase
LFQIKAIFCILLRRYEFELVDSPETYRDDYTKMVVEPASPCRVRYRRRATTMTETEASQAAGIQDSSGQPEAGFRIEVDMDLCKGHAACMGEAPELFHVDEDGKLSVLNAGPDESLLEKARNAAKYCPTQAIRLTENKP